MLAWLVLAAGAFGALADAPRIIFQEDFESYTNTESMRDFWTGGTGQLETNSPGGGNSVWHDGADMNRHGGFSIRPDETSNILLSGDFYAFALLGAARCWWQTSGLKSSRSKVSPLRLTP